MTEGKGDVHKTGREDPSPRRPSRSGIHRIRGVHPPLPTVVDRVPCTRSSGPVRSRSSARARQSVSRIVQSVWSRYSPSRRNDFRSTPSCIAPILRSAPLPRPFWTAARASSRCVPIDVEREVDDQLRAIDEHSRAPERPSRSRIPIRPCRSPARAGAPGKSRWRCPCRAARPRSTRSCRPRARDGSTR